MTAPIADPPAMATPPVTAVPRAVGIDALRGLVMVVMVLDHTRDFFTDPAINPTNLDQTTPALFLTRWVTHYCAPTFALLAGVGARLAGSRGHDPGRLARFLLTRGIWLIILEQTLEKFGLLFRVNPGFLLGLVLYSIGGSFILLSAFVAARVPGRVVGAVGLAIIVGHNLLDRLPTGSPGGSGLLSGLFLRPGIIALPGGLSAFVGYPLLPWFGVVAAGYGLGELYTIDPRRRRAALVILGLGMIGLFLTLRATGGYGDPRPWNGAGGGVRSALSFLNVTKYPPSLQFLLMTLGPALLALAALDGGVGRAGKPLLVFGRVPLFYYLLQWYVVHGMALAVALARGEPTGWLFVNEFPVVPPPSSVFALPAVYGWWLVAVAVLYGPCVWFANLKARHRRSIWLSYL